MPTTCWCLNCGTELPARNGTPGRPAEYCGTLCRQAAYRKRRKAAEAPSSEAAANRAAQDLAHDLLEDARHLVRLLDHPDAPLLDPVEQAVALTRTAETLTAALVGRARRGRVSWARLGLALSMQPDTARRIYRSEAIHRRVTNAALPQPEARTAQPPPRPDPAPALARSSRSHLAPVLSRLQRASRVTLRTLADRLGISPSQVSRILSGERFPSWYLTERFAHVCGADPMVLRKVWEDEKLREDQPRPTVPTLHDPAARLEVALRTLYIKAGRPTPAVLAEATRHAHGPDDITASLAGRPSTWSCLADLVQTLGGDPSYFQPLWEATQPPTADDQPPAPRPSPLPARPPIAADDRLLDLFRAFGPVLTTAPKL